ncbi:MAG TPA: DUF4381 domain-containing protein [Deltaproteobacteria bacterium]|jgi:hypothetical protein|nr:DUF4381 domain-containing protein [Candidatus Lambdaproteobacteria bacterium]HIL14881.1 DUF4381 domain-containing protein [Deltaproteobacteria bacterium]|tara:strand:+ start:6480 stop:6962 length:483 start_codon:yes stop_codon:yes gene_type:complete
MNPETILAQLRDAHAPPPVSWWPPAPGWWGIAVLLVLLLAFGVHWYFRTQPTRRFRKTVLAELQRIEQAHAQTQATQAALQAVSALLRRAAMSVRQRDQGAGLVGNDWLRQLDFLGKTNRFTKGPGQALVSQTYAVNTELRMEPLFDLVRDWAQSVTPAR